MPSEQRTLTYFVSDVHLGLDVKDPADRETRFVSFLRSIPASRTKALYMLGDIWDFWYEYRDVVPKGFFRVFSALSDLIEAGVRVCFFPGNHDIWCYSYFSELGIEVLEQPYSFTSGGLRFCVGHGDGLGPGNGGYKLMRALFHNRVAQSLFSLLHPWLAFRLGKGWSRQSRLAKDFEYVFRGADEPLYKFAVQKDAQEHVDVFIFGHYHVQADETLPSGSRLLLLKDWMNPQSSNWIVFDETSGCFGKSQNIEK